MSRQTEGFYISTDLALVAALSLQFPIEHIDKTNPRKVKFSLKDSNALRSLVQAYWRKEMRIEPRSYYDQLRTLKSRLYSEENL